MHISMSNLNENEQKTNISNMKAIGSVYSTNFEDLSNELIFEIFDYLDSWDVYKMFSKLNIRFQHIFISPNFRLKLILPFISKMDFLRRCEELVKMNIDRINLLSIVNCCAIDLFFKSFSIHSFIHPETLTLDDVTSNKLLHFAVELPRLFTLCITPSIYYQDENLILQNIFHLPVINYCKLTLDSNFKRISLSYAIDKQHQQYLIMDGDFLSRSISSDSVLYTSIDSLTFISVSFINFYPLSTEQLDLVHQISKTSKVIELLIEDDCSLEYVNLFVNLCPRLQRLEIVPYERQLKLIVRFLLSSNVSHLFWLCLRNIIEATSKQIETMIRREQLLIDYSIKHDYIGLYLWW